MIDLTYIVHHLFVLLRFFLFFLFIISSRGYLLLLQTIDWQSSMLFDFLVRIDQIILSFASISLSLSWSRTKLRVKEEMMQLYNSYTIVQRCLCNFDLVLIKYLFLSPWSKVVDINWVSTEKLRLVRYPGQSIRHRIRSVYAS